MSNINFKKPRIEKKILNKFKKLSNILVFQKYLGYPELGENPKDLFISSIPEWLSNSNETLSSSSRSEVIQVLENF